MVTDASTFAKVYDAPKSGLMEGFLAGQVKMTGNTAAAEKFAALLQLAKQ